VNTNDLYLTGVLNVIDGVLNTTGVSTIASGAALGLSGGTLNTDNDLNISGIFNWGDGGLAGTGDINIGATGELDVSSAGTKTVSRNLNNNGTIDVDSGTLQLQNSFTNNGIIDVDSGTTFQVAGAIFTNASGGTIQGIGSIIPPGTGFNNQGTIRPGNSPGILTVNGDLALNNTSILDLEIGGTIPGTEHDQIVVTGALSGSAGDFGTLKLTEIMDKLGYLP